MRARALFQLFAAELHHMANADFQPRLALLGYGWLVTVSVATLGRKTFPFLGSFQEPGIIVMN